MLRVRGPVSGWGERDGFLAPLDHLSQGQPHRNLVIGTALGLGPIGTTAPTGSPAAITEDGAEEVGEIAAAEAAAIAELIRVKPATRRGGGSRHPA